MTLVLLIAVLLLLPVAYRRGWYRGWEQGY